MPKYFTATTSAAMMTEIKKTTSVGALSLMAGLPAGAPAMREERAGATSGASIPCAGDV